MRKGNRQGGGGLEACPVAVPVFSLLGRQDKVHIQKVLVDYGRDRDSTYQKDFLRGLLELAPLVGEG